MVGTAGDAILVEFGSAVEAVRCAISMQEELAVRNSELPDESQMLFRIGVNVGNDSSGGFARERATFHDQGKR